MASCLSPDSFFELFNLSDPLVYSFGVVGKEACEEVAYQAGSFISLIVPAIMTSLDTVSSMPLVYTICGAHGIVHRYKFVEHYCKRGQVVE